MVLSLDAALERFEPMTSKTKVLSTHSGFTLIELVVVIVLLGVLAAFALPRYANLTTEANVAALEAVGGAISFAAHPQWL